MTARTVTIRPDLPQKRESEHLARWRSDARNLPVTPAFGHEKRQFYNVPESEGYFGLKQQLPPTGNVISATFTLPHVWYKKEKLQWETGTRFWGSIHIDCLSHLSLDQPSLTHTVVAWTGEINQRDQDPASPSASSSSDTTENGHSQEKDDSNVEKVVRINGEEQRRVETELYESPERVVPVWLFSDTEKTDDDGIALKNQSRWREYAEHDLYPLFHYKQREPSGGGDERLRWNDYHQANAAFADKICATYIPGDIILVHDYYLMLVPKMVRQRLPDARIAFVLQTPFPTSEFVRCLHRRQDLLEGILGADMVVFQAHIYAEHFANSCARILQTSHRPDDDQVLHDGRCVQLAHIPTGINIANITQRAFTPSVDATCAQVQETFAGKAVLLGHDAMNSLSGLDKKLQAYERFLHDRPEWRGRTVLLQMTSPGMLDAGDNEEEAAFATRVNHLVGSINARYGSLGGTPPVQLSPLPPRPDEYFALLRQSDIALVTSVRQGISTTALEYALCQRDRRGTLILSEFSGTAGALGVDGGAVVINPWDVAAVAEEIYNALTAGAEAKRTRHAALLRQVQDMSVERWARKLFGALEGMTREGDEEEKKKPSPIPE